MEDGVRDDDAIAGAEADVIFEVEAGVDAIPDAETLAIEREGKERAKENSDLDWEPIYVISIGQDSSWNPSEKIFTRNILT